MSARRARPALAALLEYRSPMLALALALANGTGADKCSACGECEERCPQHIPIAEKLKEAHAHLTGT